MNFPKHVDPFFLASATITLVMVVSNDPWWTVTGANQNLLTIHVSPFYLLTSAIGLSPTVPIAQVLGPLTRVLLALAFLSLEVVSIIPSAWWRDIAVCFSVSALAELYLSFALLYHAAETSLLGTYGVIPPSSGAAQLSTVIVGLDLNSHFQPFVIAGFSVSFYLGFVAFGLIGTSFVASQVRIKKERREKRGVAAIFTSDPDR